MGEVACPACHGVEYDDEEFFEHVHRAHDGLLDRPEMPPDRPYRVLLGLAAAALVGAVLLSGWVVSPTFPEGVAAIGAGLLLVGLPGGAVVLRRDIHAFEGALRGADRATQLLFAAWFLPVLGQSLVFVQYTRRRRRKLDMLDDYAATVRRVDDRVGDAIAELVEGDPAVATETFLDASIELRRDEGFPAAYEDLQLENWNHCVRLERQADERAEDGAEPTDADIDEGSRSTGDRPDGEPPDAGAQVEELLEANGGRMRRADIADETGWSTARTKRVTGELAAADRVDLTDAGSATVVTLPDTLPGPKDADEVPYDVWDEGADAAGGGAGVDGVAAGRGAADGEVGTGADTPDNRATAGPVDGATTVIGDEAAGPPEHVPATPDIEVDYDAIEHHERIGSGGQATVTRATVDGVEVAVKEPVPNRTLRTEEAERFVTEAETWAKLDDHEGIVTVLGWGTRPHPWLAMEYMDGGHVGARSFGVEQAVWTAYRTAGAVREAHRQGVAHLDLKPANVLLRGTDGWPVPKVADWGLARHLLEEGSVEGLSPPYAAPEQFDEHRGEPDNLTDVYALGALTYELLTAQPPFEGAVGEIREQVLDPAVTPVPPSERRADVPPALDGVVERALATARDDRYEDVLLFRNDLHEVYTGLRD